MDDGAGDLTRALNGDADAWNRLVDRYAGLVWSVVRSYRIDSASQEDAYQATWLRLLDRGSTIRDPDKLASWLVTVAKRECLALARASSRVVPATESLDGLLPSTELGSNLEQRQTGAEVRRLFEQLDEACRVLLGMLVADPPLSYAMIGAALDMPVGSIGPTRGRCLDKLRKNLAETRIVDPRTASTSQEEAE